MYLDSLEASRGFLELGFLEVLGLGFLWEGGERCELGLESCEGVGRVGGGVLRGVLLRLLSRLHPVYKHFLHIRSGTQRVYESKNGRHIHEASLV